ncbi:TPA: hypothetical protein RRA56_003811 [Pseudomonas aeruginosa]|nr:hypothetical protein [Pseudomonas aeruginosa]
MADYPDLRKYLHSALEWETECGPIDLGLARSLVSSPRLMSFQVKAFSHPGLVAAGDTYLDARTMLADSEQKTYAIAYEEWTELEESITFVERFSWWDKTVMNIQVWPYAPAKLEEFSMAVAVALSYTSAELMAESRISLAMSWFNNGDSLLMGSEDPQSGLSCRPDCNALLQPAYHGYVKLCVSSQSLKLG